MTNQNETALNNQDDTAESELEQLSVDELVEKALYWLNESESELDGVSESTGADVVSGIICDIDDARSAVVELLRRALGTESEGGEA